MKKPVDTSNSVPLMTPQLIHSTLSVEDKTGLYLKGFREGNNKGETTNELQAFLESHRDQSKPLDTREHPLVVYVRNNPYDGEMIGRIMSAGILGNKLFLINNVLKLIKHPFKPTKLK